MIKDLFDPNLVSTAEPTPTQRQVETSRESAKELDRSGRASQYRQIIYDYIKTIPSTCDEIESTLGIRHQTASCYIRFLTQDGHLKDSGERRLTRSGRRAIVWAAVS